MFEEIENGLGRPMQRIHSHFSKIEYSKGGEVRHLTFVDEEFGPSFEEVLNVTVRKTRRRYSSANRPAPRRPMPF